MLQLLGRLQQGPGSVSDSPGTRRVWSSRVWSSSVAQTIRCSDNRLGDDDRLTKVGFIEFFQDQAKSTKCKHRGSNWTTTRNYQVFPLVCWTS